MLSPLLACALVAIGAIVSSAPPELPRAGIRDTSQAPADSSPFVGKWTADLSKSKLHPDFKIQSLTLQFAVTADTVTVSSELMFASGQRQNPAETFRTDGTEVPGRLTPGVTLTARWVGSHLLETRARKDGQEIGIVTYEVSRDGNTLTSRSSGAAMPEQMIVFERNR